MISPFRRLHAVHASARSVVHCSVQHSAISIRFPLSAFRFPLSASRFPLPVSRSSLRALFFFPFITPRSLPSSIHHSSFITHHSSLSSPLLHRSALSSSPIHHIIHHSAISLQPSAFSIRFRFSVPSSPSSIHHSSFITHRSLLVQHSSLSALFCHPPSDSRPSAIGTDSDPGSTFTIEPRGSPPGPRSASPAMLGRLARKRSV